MRWIDNGGEPKDLTSLMLNILVYKLGVGLSLDSKLVMSGDGKFIFVCIRGDIKDLKRVAEEEEFNA